MSLEICNSFNISIPLIGIVKLGQIRARPVGRRRLWEVGRPDCPNWEPSGPGWLGRKAVGDWLVSPASNWGEVPIGGEAGLEKGQQANLGGGGWVGVGPAVGSGCGWVVCEPQPQLMGHGWGLGGGNWEQRGQWGKRRVMKFFKQ